MVKNNIYSNKPLGHGKGLSALDITTVNLMVECRNKLVILGNMKFAPECRISKEISIIFGYVSFKYFIKLFLALARL